MHVFYTPDIQTRAELPEEEAQHCVRVLRLNIGDQITLTDGKGYFYRAEISAATNKRYGTGICTLQWPLPRIWTVQNGLQKKLLR